MSKMDEAMKEASILIKSARSHEELNQIAHKYWGTKNAPIKGINKVITMENMVVERRRELGAKMGNKQDP